VKIIDEHNRYETLELENKWKRLAKYMKKNIPELQWSLAMLSTVNPEHEIFKKNYQAPVKGMAPQQQFMIPINNGFMNDLPELSAKERKRGGGISFLTKQQKLEMQLQRLEEKQQKLELSKQKKQADLLLAKDENSDEDNG
jgi:hypothetical protein